MKGIAGLRAGMAAVLVLAGVAGCREKAAPAKVPPPVRVAVAEVPGGAEGTHYTGNIEPRVRVDLAFKVSGYIVEVMKVRDADGALRLVQEGDTVKAGDVLCRVQEDNYRVKLQQAQGGLGQAEAALENATNDFRRATDLRAQGAIPQAVLDGATAKLNGTKAAVAYARGLVGEAKVYLNDTALKAPLDATVMKRLVEVGSLVGGGVGGFVLADTRTLRIVVGVSDRDLPRFPMGADVPVRVDVLGLDLTGHVTRVSPYADPKTRVFEVEVAIPNDDGHIKPGMFAALGGAAEGPAALPAVPLAALVRPPGATEGYAVFVVEEAGGGALAKVRRVVPGEVRGGRIEVADGLRAGERVVVTGASFLADGQAVTVVP